MTLRVAEDVERRSGSVRRLAREAGVAVSTLSRSLQQHAFTTKTTEKLEAAFARSEHSDPNQSLHKVLLLIQHARILLDDAEDRTKAALDGIGEQQ